MAIGTVKPDTGHGATVTFGTSAWAGLIRAIPSNVAKSIPVVNISNLATTTNELTMPGDLAAITECELDVLFASATAMPALGVEETITITFPLQSSGASVAANIAGTGFISGITFPPLQTNQENIGKIKFQYNGSTGPTFTACQA